MKCSKAKKVLLQRLKLIFIHLNTLTSHKQIQEGRGNLTPLKNKVKYLFVHFFK